MLMFVFYTKQRATTIFDNMQCFTLIFFSVVFFHLLYESMYFIVFFFGCWCCCYFFLFVLFFVVVLVTAADFFFLIQYSVFRVHDSWTSPKKISQSRHIKKSVYVCFDLFSSAIRFGRGNEQTNACMYLSNDSMCIANISSINIIVWRYGSPYIAEDFSRHEYREKKNRD